MQVCKKMIMAVLLIVAVFSGTMAHAAPTNLPAGILIGDQNGINVSVDGEYFIEWDGLEASDVLTKKLTIMNVEPYSYKISMTAEPMEESGPLKLLDEVHLNLKLDGKVLYDGRVRGDEGINMILNALDLGSYNSGDSRVLEITMTVNPDMQKYYWRTSESLFKWNFHAARDVQETGPNTGEIVKYSIYGLLAVVMVATAILLVLKKKKQEQQVREGMPNNPV